MADQQEQPEWFLRPVPPLAEDGPTWGSPAPVDVEAGALREGETDEPPVTFTETVVPPSAMRERVDTGEPLPPLLPAWLTSWQVAREVAQRQARHAGRGTVRAAVRTPPVTARAAWWAARGAGNGAGRVILWVWDKQGHPVFGAQPATTDQAYHRMATERAARQKFRLKMVAVAILGMLVGLAALAGSPTRLAVAVLTLGVILARFGKPEGVRLLSPNATKAYRPRLTHQGVVAALQALAIVKLTNALATDSSRIWRSDFTPVRGGHRIELQLPASTLASEIVQHEQRIASALARPADTVIVEPLPHRTPSDLRLWIFDKPVLAAKRGPGPLARARKTSWFEPVEIGITRTAQTFSLSLRGGAWFTGGEPGSGKSTAAQLAAAHTALDPRALLLLVNLKGSPDYAWAEPICHRYICGSPETDSTALPRVTLLLQWLLDETGRRNDFLGRLVKAKKADSNDVTPELAAKYDELRSMTVILDEIHRLIDRTDNPDADLAAELLGKVIKACRSVAITLICVTQLAGTESIPPVLTRAARVRGCLKVQDEVSWRQIFGNAGRGSFDVSGVSTLPRGTVILRTEEGAPTKVGCHHLQPAHLGEIGKRALAMRKDLELLTGEAAGLQVADAITDPRQLLRDVLAAIPSAAPTGGPQDAGVAWLSGLEASLALAGDGYAGRADGWLSGELRARHVDTGQVNRRWTEDGEARQRTAAAVRADAVRAALADLPILT